MQGPTVASRPARARCTRPSVLGVCLGALFLLLPAEGFRAAEGDNELAEAEKLLREAKVATDGPGLMKFFRDRTLPEAERAKLAGTVRRLGDEEFEVRQKAFKDLLVAGRAALPFLRQAKKDPDPQIADSAARLLERIESGSDAALTAAAARVLADRKPAGAVPVLLAYLPLADEELVQEAVLDALATIGLRGGKVDPELAAARKDKDPLRRLAAAHLFARAGPDERKSLRAMLTDPDARVRFEAATALVRAEDKAGVEPLIGMLTDEPRHLAEQAEDLLYRLAGDKPPAGVDAGEADARRKAWEAWWKENGTQVDLARLKREPALRGLTVVCEHDGAGKDGQGRIWECDKDGKPRWEISGGLGGPLDVFLLPNRRVLISEYNSRRVTERDRDGKILWEKRVNNNAVSAQRLANGNTFIATRSEIMEVTKDGRTVYSHQKGDVYRATKLRNGHIVYTTGTQVVELDATGKQVTAVNLNGLAWGSADKLPNGRYLVALYGGGKVVEVDAAGKVFWECQVASPAMAVRLRNGHTVVASSEGRMVAEYDQKGKEVWKQRVTGRVWSARRY
jgi:HEAT repeat protein